MHYEPVEDGGRRPTFDREKRVQWFLHDSDLFNNQFLKFVIKDDESDGCLSKIRGRAVDDKYIGTAFFNLISGWDTMDEDPTIIPKQDSQDRDNDLFDKVFDEELDLYKMENDEAEYDDDYKYEAKNFEGEISAIIKIMWFEGHEQRWQELHKLLKLQEAQKKIDDQNKSEDTD